MSCSIVSTTVIIPTLASDARAASLARAVASVLDQDVDRHVLAVVNGGRRSEAVVAGLRAEPDVELLELAQGDLVKALVAGVAAVRTAYFCVLDDDDELLPGALRARARFLDAHPQLAAVATPGERRFANGRTVRVPERFDADDPLASLFDCNWLASCGGAYRRGAVDAAEFAAMPKYLEWTHLASRLLLDGRIGFMFDAAAPQFRVHETAGSLSDSRDYWLAMPDNVERLRDPRFPPAIDRLILRKAARTRHIAVDRSLKAGDLRTAWRLHLKNLARPGGLHYLSFTRRLLLRSLTGRGRPLPAAAGGDRR